MASGVGENTGLGERKSKMPSPYFLVCLLLKMNSATMEAIRIRSVTSWVILMSPPNRIPRSITPETLYKETGRAVHHQKPDEDLPLELFS